MVEVYTPIVKVHSHGVKVGGWKVWKEVGGELVETIERAPRCSEERGRERVGK